MLEYSETIRKICEKLWDSEDPDCKEAEEYGFKEDIITLFEDCFDYESFCKWLAKNDCNPANHFRDAEIANRCDCDTTQEWKAIIEDALFYNSEFACVSW